MESFRDNKGRTWKVEFTVGILPKFRKAGFDLKAEGKDGAKLVDTLLEDQETFVQRLWLLVEDQAATAGVEPEDFGKGLNREAMQEAMKAYILEFADFFRGPAVVEALKARLPALEILANQKATQAVNQAMDAAMQSLDSKSFVGASPDSRESPIPSR